MTLWDQNRPATQRPPLEEPRCLPYILGPGLDRETSPPGFVRVGSHPFLRWHTIVCGEGPPPPPRAPLKLVSWDPARRIASPRPVGEGRGRRAPRVEPSRAQRTAVFPAPRPISTGIRRRARTRPPVRHRCGRGPARLLRPGSRSPCPPRVRPRSTRPHLPCHLRPIRRGSRSPDEAQLIHTSPVPPAHPAHPGHEAWARHAVNLECDTGPPARFLGPLAYESPSKGPRPRRRAPSRDPWRMTSGPAAIQRMGPWMYASQTSGALVHPREGGTLDVWFAPCARLTSLCRAPNLPPAASPTHSTIGLPRRLTLSPSSGGGTRWLTRSAI
jgi:hypothetical protein